MNKKFTINLTTLIGIISAISTIIGGYWYFKNTIETTRDGIKSANENYKELKNEIQILRERLYEMAVTYNKNVQLENEIHPEKEIRRSYSRYEEDSVATPPLRLAPVDRRIIKPVMDTIDISKIKTKPNIQLPIKLKK